MNQSYLILEVGSKAACSHLKPEINDVALVQNAQGGDVQALECLFCQHGPAFCRHAEQACGDPTAAEDLCQEACIKAISRLPCLAVPSNFRGWVFGIIDNETRHWRRKLKIVGTRTEPIGTHIIETMSARFDPGSAEDLLVVLCRLTDHLPVSCRVTARFMIEQYQQQEGFPSVRAIAQATHDSQGSAQRHRQTVLGAWRRALEQIDASDSHARRRPICA